MHFSVIENSLPVRAYLESFSYSTDPRRALPTRGPHAARVMVVDHRDEVFARLEADLRILRLSVRCARGVAQASAARCTESFDLILLNDELPEESGWLWSAKWHLSGPPVRTWLYTAKPVDFGDEAASLGGIEEVLYYAGDLLRLSEAIVDRLHKLVGRRGVTARKVASR